MKQCSKCKEWKTFDFFNKSKNRKDGLSPQCKQCQKDWRTANKEILSVKKKEYYSRPEIKEKYLVYKKEYWGKNRHVALSKMREYYESPENRAKKLWFSVKERCKHNAIPFDITPEDIKIPTHCPYLGIELTHTLGKGMLNSNSSVDRIIPELGYIKGNIQVISLLANQMKNSATKDQLITFAKNIIKQYEV